MTIHVNVAFIDDHKEQMHLWTDFRTRFNLGEDFDAYTACNSILQHLQAHFKHEEILYSQYRESAGDLANLISLIREQHNKMIFLLERFVERDFDKNEIHAQLGEFEKLLYAHIVLEEKQLYPELDRVLTEETKERVIQDLKIDTTHKKLI